MSEFAHSEERISSCEALPQQDSGGWVNERMETGFSFSSNLTEISPVVPVMVLSSGWHLV